MRERRRRIKGSRHHAQQEYGTRRILEVVPPSLPPGQTETTYLTLSHKRCDPSQKMEEQNTQRPPVYRVVVSCVHYSLSIQIKMHAHSDNFYEKYSILCEHIPIQQKW